MTDRDIKTAAYFWQNGRDTHHIGRLLKIEEAIVFAHMAQIRAAARRIAISEAVYRATSPYTNGGRP